MPDRPTPSAVREVGLRDGLQILARTMPTATEARMAARQLRGRAARDRGRLVRPAQDCCPSSPTPRRLVAFAKSLPGLTVSVLVPNLKGAERAIDAGADLMLLPLSASRAHSLANLRKTPDDVVDEIARIRDLRDARGFAVRDRGRHQHRIRLHDPGPRRAGRSAAPARSARWARAPSAWGSPIRSATPIRCRWRTLFAQAFADRGRAPRVRALSRHARPGSRQRVRGMAAGRRPIRRVPRRAWAAVRTRRARAGTSPPRTSPTSSPAWASRPSWTSIA